MLSRGSLWAPILVWHLTATRHSPRAIAAPASSASRGQEARALGLDPASGCLVLLFGASPRGPSKRPVPQNPPAGRTRLRLAASLRDVVRVMENLTSNALDVACAPNPGWNVFGDEIRANRPFRLESGVADWYESGLTRPNGPSWSAIGSERLACGWPLILLKARRSMTVRVRFALQVHR